MKLKSKHNKLKRRKLNLLEKEALNRLLENGYRAIPIYKLRAYIKADKNAIKTLYFDKLLNNKLITKDNLKSNKMIDLSLIDILFNEN